MILYTYYAVVALASAVALINWRKGVFACLVLDVLRDPVRKLVPEHPVLITVAVGGVWCLVFAGFWLSERHRIDRFTRAYPRCRTAFYLLVAALVPAAVISLVSYSGGWILAAAGGTSYLFLPIALLLGFAFARTERDVTLFLVCYCLVNAVAFSGALLEFGRVPFPALGGIDYVWFRTGHDFFLISGFYRSPDLLGLHAAHVFIFSGILAGREKSRWRPLWIALACLAGVVLLLSGRRKMIVMPVVFGFFVLLVLSRNYRHGWAFQAAAALLAVAVGTWALMPSGTERYLDYAATTPVEGFDRINPIPKVRTTLQQAGLLGYGLGTATQGSYHIAAHGQRTWQEDGMGRLAAEVGLPGVVLVLAATFLLVRDVLGSLPRQERRGRIPFMQYSLVGVFAANIASFLASHQAYSGDPSSIAIACMTLGFAMALPHLAEGRSQSRPLPRRAGAMLPGFMGPAGVRPR